MRKLLMVISVVAFVAISGPMKAQTASGALYVADIEQLGKYLELSSIQFDEVYHINEHFISMQKKVLKSDESCSGNEMKNALFTNLKLMKQTLTADQYRKYVGLLNLTHNNQQISKSAVNETYYAGTGK